MLAVIQLISLTVALAAGSASVTGFDASKTIIDNKTQTTRLLFTLSVLNAWPHIGQHGMLGFKRTSFTEDDDDDSALLCSSCRHHKHIKDINFYLELSAYNKHTRTLSEMRRTIIANNL